MTKSNIDKIKDLLNYLSERDRELSNKLIEQKEFHAIRDLVKSCIKKQKKYSKNPTLDETVIMLELLYSEIDNYIILIYDEDGEDDLTYEDIDLEINELIEEI